MNKMWNDYTTKYYSTIKINEIVKHTTTWMQLENMVILYLNS